MNSKAVNDKNKIKIGIDFDNTIICYDTVFNKVGIEKELIPQNLSCGKNNVRNYLRTHGKEEEWIKLQGYVYGERLFDASPFEGVKKFFSYCSKADIHFCIISHKTLHPYLGYPYDLHRSAYQWLEQENFDCDIFFELSKEEKINRISEQRCTHFIDDLPEFLTLPGFPDPIVKILFDPLEHYSEDKIDSSLKLVRSWEEILILLQKDML